MLNLLELREGHGGGSLRSYENIAAICGDLFGSVAGCIRKLESLRPMLDRISRVRVTDLNVENLTNMGVRSVARTSPFLLRD
jgi:hypothetical protein